MVLRARTRSDPGVSNIRRPGAIDGANASSGMSRPRCARLRGSFMDHCRARPSPPGCFAPRPTRRADATSERRRREDGVDRTRPSRRSSLPVRARSKVIVRVGMTAVTNASPGSCRTSTAPTDAAHLDARPRVPSPRRAPRRGEHVRSATPAPTRGKPDACALRARVPIDLDARVRASGARAPIRPIGSARAE